MADETIETEPLLESTRRFLRPRVGIDPATVPVVRGPIADRVVQDAGADAAAVGDAILLPSALDERSPRTLGLLAHELTHVAHRRNARFVPPVIRSATEAEVGERRATLGVDVPPSSEERLARRVERYVWSDAEESAQYERGGTVSGEDAEPAHSARRFDAGAERASNEWGNLPAPWEPLPVVATASMEAAVAAPATMMGATEQAIHYAEHGRAFEGEEPSSTHKAPAEAAPPPDIDALARRVYDVLKRRLAAERRREG